MAAGRKGLGGEGSASPPPHVLAVDDSSVDRAVIASILRSSQFRGEQSLIYSYRSRGNAPSSVLLCCGFASVNLKPCRVLRAVTAVDSGKRALELLGSVRISYSTESLLLLILFWILPSLFLCALHEKIM
jgi:CheY-like chemotaxis protein